ncbi:hypothetical protein BRM3_03000 [Brachybacterium huguangmaarense]|uniref:Uncharacterized protein n=1 Tax=Brachybacterium huguangmaarense TaxID=1652028 RepID=A0ABY6G2S2_9MICO|nr:hypothetical protein [Brachybacterium huguangmaarense]UYG17417.1 hypothetical protein BRM3_03000 [Brachybacterium huguangmaarense]
MTAPGADSASERSPVAAGPAPDDVLTWDDLRMALRPPGLPLPFPTTVLEAAHRVHDLTDLGRLGAARMIAESFAAEPAPLPERVELLVAHARALHAGGQDHAAADVLREMVGLIDGSGHHEHARAAVVALGLTDPAASSAAERRGRRRADPLSVVEEADVDEAVLVVVRGLTERAPTAAEALALGEEGLEHEEGRFLSALSAYPEVRDAILGDPEPLLRLRYAQVLRLQDRSEDAAFQARDVLEHLALRAADDDVERSATTARAILAWALRPTEPLTAARHGADALLDLHRVDDPRLRVAVIQDLVQDLVAAGRAAQADYAASRLDSLLRTLPTPVERVAPLLVVAAARIAVGRPDEATRPLADARPLARAERDHHALLRVHRLAAEVHRRGGRLAQAVQALGQAASDAQHLGDDLGATRAERGRFLRAELEARGLALRLALDASLPDIADAEARGILTRIRRTRGWPVVPEAVLWEHTVDAHVGRMIAAATSGAGDAAVYAARRAEVADAIAAAPQGQAERARYWAVYLEDRDAAMLERLGKRGAALAAARRALEGWRELGESDHAHRTSADVARLEGAAAE